MKGKSALRRVTIGVLVRAAVWAGCSSNDRLIPQDPNPGPLDPCQAIPLEPVGSVTFTLDTPDVAPPADTIPHRPWPETIVSYQPAEVKHLALYLKEPIEKWAVDDGHFGTWRFEDALALMADPAVFLARIAIIPVEAYLAPPWQEASSRGSFARQEPAYALPWCPSGMTRNEQYERDY